MPKSTSIYNVKDTDNVLVSGQTSVRCVFVAAEEAPGLLADNLKH